jgi:chaperone modulatory protein CbpM
VLDLVDQLHGVRAALRGLALALHTLPTPLREQALAALRAADGGEAE